jgi:hypothetical protein
MLSLLRLRDLKLRKPASILRFLVVESNRRLAKIRDVLPIKSTLVVLLLSVTWSLSATTLSRLCLTRA